MIVINLMTFAFAFVTLLLFIHIPERNGSEHAKENLLTAAQKGIGWLRENPLILTLILYLAMSDLTKKVGDFYRTM